MKYVKKDKEDIGSVLLFNFFFKFLYNSKATFHLQLFQNIAYTSHSVVKSPPASAGGIISSLGRYTGGEHGDPLQYSCLENPLDRGA